MIASTNNVKTIKELSINVWVLFLQVAHFLQIVVSRSQVIEVHSCSKGSYKKWLECVPCPPKPGDRSRPKFNQIRLKRWSHGSAMLDTILDLLVR